MAAKRAKLPQSVLFACRMNAIRSPMAAALLRHYFRLMYVTSIGIHKGEHDPFVDIVMAEVGIDISKHRPKTFDELEETEGLNFDLVISLSPEAHHRAIELTRSLSVEVEYWPTPEPDMHAGNREQVLAHYREVRDLLMRRIRAKFFGQTLSSADNFSAHGKSTSG